jgi:thiamine biosynthesis lipoprotein
MPSRARDRGVRFGRREALALGVGAFVVAAVPLAARRRRALVRRRIPVMGTIAEIAVDHPDRQRAQHAITDAFAELRYVDRTMTRFHDASDVGRANLEAARRPVPVTRATAEVLAAALAWADATEGAFDPCLGAATRLWDVNTRRRPPGGEELRALAGRRLHTRVELEARASRRTVRFAATDVALDLGGIAKGWAVDRAVEVLRDRGIENALVNAGGDLRGVGVAADGEPWRIGVRSAADPRRISGTLRLRDAAVATSGDYAQSFRHAGRTYHHLLDPATGAPRDTEVHSLTVVAATCTAADAAATGLFGMRRDRADAILAAHAPGGRIVDPA